MAVNSERRALYPGSFDPPTNGHKWVMEKVSDDYDTGIVAIGHNPEKAGRFPLSEREEMLEEIAQEYPNLIITRFHGLYQADFAEMQGANVIVRGMRSADYNFENDISQVNRTINPKIETTFKIPPNELQQVSSSMVMGMVGFEGWEQPVRLMVPATVFDRIEHRQKMIDKDKLGKKWNNLHSRLSANGDSKSQFEKLYSTYQEPQRAYHAIPHIKTCLDELSLVESEIENPDAVELAIWFHDSVYESSIPQNSDNPEKRDDEGQSAELARKAIVEEMGLSQDLANTVTDLILATKHSGNALTMDEKYMVDIDLAILGRSSRLFDEYETKIRQEYNWVHEDVFRDGRAKILETFLPPARPNIYQTPFFQERYERQAKNNLERSIANLQIP
jgi:pantetheine-phosphate adenylyltransferase